MTGLTKAPVSDEEVRLLTSGGDQRFLASGSSPFLGIAPRACLMHAALSLSARYGTEGAPIDGREVR